MIEATGNVEVALFAAVVPSRCQVELPFTFFNILKGSINVPS